MRVNGGNGEIQKENMMSPQEHNKSLVINTKNMGIFEFLEWGFKIGFFVENSMSSKRTQIDNSMNSVQQFIIWKKNSTQKQTKIVALKNLINHVEIQAEERTHKFESIFKWSFTGGEENEWKRKSKPTELRRHHSINKYSDYGHFREKKDKDRSWVHENTYWKFTNC